MRLLKCAIVLASLALVNTANADNITLFAVTPSTDNLSLVAVPPPGNQPLNTPCLICGTQQPQQPTGFGYNNYFQNGNETNFIEFSSSTVGAKLQQDTLGTGYDVSFLKAFLASQLAGNLAIGIDVNTATGSGPEVLERFAILNLTQHTILSQYVGPTALPTLNNGSGFPDYVLNGFNIDRSDIAIGDQLLFYARWSNTSDGAESFFLVPQAVPGPIVGAGIPGLVVACGGLLALARRRRNLTA
jgi:hypothetical protein